MRVELNVGGAYAMCASHFISRTQPPNSMRCHSWRGAGGDRVAGEDASKTLWQQRVLRVKLGRIQFATVNLAL